MRYRSKRGLYLLASTSVIALGLTAVPVAMDFELDKPVLKIAQAKGGGEGGEGGEGGDSGHGGDEAGPDDEADKDGGSSGNSRLGFGDLEQIGQDLSTEEEAKSILDGWQ